MINWFLIHGLGTCMSQHIWRSENSYRVSSFLPPCRPVNTDRQQVPYLLSCVTGSKLSSKSSGDSHHCCEESFNCLPALKILLENQWGECWLTELLGLSQGPPACCPSFPTELHPTCVDSLCILHLITLCWPYSERSRFSATSNLWREWLPHLSPSDPEELTVALLPEDIQVKQWVSVMWGAETSQTLFQAVWEWPFFKWLVTREMVQPCWRPWQAQFLFLLFLLLTPAPACTSE